ncbi:MAG: hypothetical protein ACTSX1_09300 [Candidatus Heimdallarchaeaceae archaeon]
MTDIVKEEEQIEMVKSVKVDKEPVAKLSENLDETKELYDDFSNFLKKKTEMVPDSGEKATISTGLDLIDAILGGGFAIGALNIIVGSPGSGKSMLAIQTLGQSQQQFNGKLLGAFLDSEEATTQVRLSNLGVRYPEIQPYNGITVEKVFKFIEGVCLYKTDRDIIETPSTIIWDSIANTLSQKEREAEDINSVIGYKARLLSILIPKYVAKCAQHNICLIAVNQLREVLNIGMFSAPKDLKFMSATKDMPGGQILKYNSFHLIEMNVKKKLEAKKYGFDGIMVKLKCVKNKLFPPNVEIDVLGSFVNGFSNFWTNFNFLGETNRLNTGPWNLLVSLPNKKFRTKDAETLYNEDPEFREAFDRDIKEAIQLDIIDKNNPKPVPLPTKIENKK